MNSWIQRLRWEDEMFRGSRYGYACLLRYKGFTTVAVLSLALSIGNTAVFTLVNAVMLAIGNRK